MRVYHKKIRMRTITADLCKNMCIKKSRGGHDSDYTANKNAVKTINTSVCAIT